MKTISAIDHGIASGLCADRAAKPTERVMTKTTKAISAKI